MIVLFALFVIKNITRWEKERNQRKTSFRCFFGSLKIVESQVYVSDWKQRIKKIQERNSNVRSLLQWLWLSQVV